eukprot:CAMPEP_0172168070 /NCGR_PEP_ID=MMETSP1050-20130122/9927_1 /TAXON_ID=233186 /ORGANISM="Cryptomonas curvata, Strain CCAP979/52" /LENGTH=228 /DNA_ID=CAMNT_0012838939 /DNA_START=119 /DNA_END=805 /DNA_ORIENTATION=-
MSWFPHLNISKGWSLSPPKELKWIKFETQEDLSKWRLGCDSDYGGKSHCSFAITEKGTGLFSGSLDNTPIEVVKEKMEYEISISRPTPLFDLYKGRKTPEMARAGFAAISSLPMALETDLQHMNVLLCRVRTDGRLYLASLRTDALRPGFVYQAPIRGRPGEWSTVRLPLRDFVLTDRGLVFDSKVMMNLRSVSTFGITIMDKLDGPFEVEIESVIAIRDRAVGDPDD